MQAGTDIALGDEAVNLALLDDENGADAVSVQELEDIADWRHGGDADDRLLSGQDLSDHLDLPFAAVGPLLGRCWCG